MMAPPARFTDARRRPRWWVIALVVLGHALALYGLARVFAPDAVQSVERGVLATFNVTITAPPPSPTPAPVPDEGAAGSAGEQAVPRSDAAPSPRLPVRRDVPRPPVASTGAANTSGASASGAGTGAGGDGAGTGSGGGGGGQGGAVVTRPVKIAGDINSAADFPVPSGGREARFGTSVTVRMTVGVDGRARDCQVVRPSPDPQADAIVCELAETRFRFRPATDGTGKPVAAVFGWRQEWFSR